MSIYFENYYCYIPDILCKLTTVINVRPIKVNVYFISPFSDIQAKTSPYRVTILRV